MANPNPLQDLFNNARLAALDLETLGQVTPIVSALTGGGLLALDGVPQWVLDEASRVTGQAEQVVGSPIFDLIIGAAIGVDLSPAGAPDAQSALGILKRIIGFTVALPFATGRIEAVLKALLGEHAPTALLDAIHELPAELGMNFFIPQILTNIVDVATGTPLREAIAEQTRPFRLEWPQLRALLRTHQLDEATLRQRFAKIGVPDQDMGLLLALDRQALPVGDIQQAYLAGLVDEAGARDLLQQLGFEGATQDLLVQLYLVRAETAGGDQLRLAAQEGFLADHLTAEQYRAILDQVHVPPASAALEIEAATLRKDWQQHTLTVAEIKQLTQDGQLTDPEAVQRLVAMNYAATDAAKLVQSWHKAARAAHAGLTKDQVLAYQAHGVLTPVQAYDYLIGLGIKPDDAKFLVDHPTLTSPVRIQPVTQAAIISAYKDDVIDRTTAAQLLAGLPTAQEQITLLLAVADDAIAKGNKPKAAHKALTEAQVIEAYKNGLATEEWATRELVVLGYSQADAQLIVTIEATKLAGAVPASWTVLN